MTPMRHWLENQRGFSLAELLVATAVIGLVMAGVFVVQQEGQQAYLLGSSRVETQPPSDAVPPVKKGDDDDKKDGKKKDEKPR